jgi:hypothetical protein
MPEIIKRRGDLLIVKSQPGQMAKRMFDHLFDLRMWGRADRGSSGQRTTHYRVLFKPLGGRRAVAPLLGASALQPRLVPAARRSNGLRGPRVAVC